MSDVVHVFVSHSHKDEDFTQRLVTDLHHTLHPGGMRATEVLRLTKVHRLVLRMLGPAYEDCYLTAQEIEE